MKTPATVPPAVAFSSLVVCAGTSTLLDLPALHIRTGERVAIVGHNGAGKSTLLRCLSGFVLPHRGNLQVLGRPLEIGLGASALRQLRTEIGQVMQGVHLVQRVSALDNVLMGLLGQRSGWRTWIRVHTPSDIRQAEASLAAVGMLGKADNQVDKLSGGERQKIAIARMLVQAPSLILADEPTASLDPLAASEVCSLLAQAARGATLVTVVHNPSLLPILADRVIGLKGGRLAFDLPVGEVGDIHLAKLYRPDSQVEAPPWAPLNTTATSSP